MVSFCRAGLVKQPLHHHTSLGYTCYCSPSHICCTQVHNLQLVLLRQQLKARYTSAKRFAALYEGIFVAVMTIISSLALRIYKMCMWPHVCILTVWVHRAWMLLVTFLLLFLVWQKKNCDFLMSCSSTHIELTETFIWAWFRCVFLSYLVGTSISIQPDLNSYFASSYYSD